jgi:hypothetical protein
VPEPTIQIWSRADTEAVKLTVAATKAPARRKNRMMFPVSCQRQPSQENYACGPAVNGSLLGCCPRQARQYQLLILDDIAYVAKDQAETSVLFELIAARYERRSLLITANQPFGEWGKIFTDKTMTLAAIDRLVHHATIVEMNVESYRRKAALKRKRGKGN